MVYLVPHGKSKVAESLGQWPLCCDGMSGREWERVGESERESGREWKTEREKVGKSVCV